MSRSRAKVKSTIVEILREWNDKHPEGLEAALCRLEAILSRSSDQSRWSIQAKKLEPLLVSGLNHNDPKVQTQAVKCQDLLLKSGLFDFLEVKSKQLLWQ